MASAYILLLSIIFFYCSSALLLHVHNKQIELMSAIIYIHFNKLGKIIFIKTKKNIYTFCNIISEIIHSFN